MLSIVCSDQWGHGFGPLHRQDGQPYKTDKGAFRNHPCTIWANSFVMNWQWLLHHGLALCSEYKDRYGKDHTCLSTLEEARVILPTGDPTGRSGQHTPFVFGGPDEFKLDTTISIFDKYKMYIIILNTIVLITTFVFLIVNLIGFDLCRDEFVWVEKYRPKTIDECILPTNIKKTFQDFLDKGEVPNLPRLNGPPGCGRNEAATSVVV